MPKPFPRFLSLSPSKTVNKSALHLPSETLLYEPFELPWVLFCHNVRNLHVHVAMYSRRPSFKKIFELSRTNNSNLEALQSYSLCHLDVSYEMKIKALISDDCASHKNAHHALKF